MLRSGLAVLVLAWLCGMVPAAALDFRLQPIRVTNCSSDCPNVIVATGQIYLDDHLRLEALFRNMAADARVARILLVNSPGGQAGGGFRLGYIARSLKLTVVVADAIDDQRYGPALCASACTFLLSGGVKRIVVPGSVVGIHWAAEPPPRYDAATGGFLYQPKVDDSELAAEFRRFFKIMGVNPKIVDLMRAVPNSEGRELSAKELRALRLATSTRF